MLMGLGFHRAHIGSTHTKPTPFPWLAAKQLSFRECKIRSTTTVTAATAATGVLKRELLKTESPKAPCNKGPIEESQGRRQEGYVLSSGRNTVRV